MADVTSHASTSGQVRTDWLKFADVSYRLFLYRIQYKPSGLTGFDSLKDNSMLAQ